MKKARIASLLALVLSLPGLAAAAVPQTMSFSARIADNGRPVTGSHTVKFAFWDCDGSAPLTCVDPANVLWSETQTLTVSDGVVTTVLGADTTTPNPLPAAIFNGGPLFLEVTFDGTAFSPRMAVHSVPYALRAAEADHATTANSATSAGSATTAGSVPWGGITGMPVGLSDGVAFSCQGVTIASVASVAAGGFATLSARANDCPPGTWIVSVGCEWSGPEPFYSYYCFAHNSVIYARFHNAGATAGTLHLNQQCCRAQ